MELPLDETLFNHRGVFVMRNVQEGVRFGAHQTAVYCIFFRQHGALQLVIITSPLKERSGRCDCTVRVVDMILEQYKE